jgi:hypothetical protein
MTHRKPDEGMQQSDALAPPIAPAAHGTLRPVGDSLEGLSFGDKQSHRSF